MKIKSKSGSMFEKVFWVVCLKSVIFLPEKLFKEKNLTFLLTYKLSQDHLETFFACMTTAWRLHNNPTAGERIFRMNQDI